MTELLNQTLFISAVGMGLVFLSLILLWWLMAGMVRLFQDRRQDHAEKNKPVSDRESAPFTESAAAEDEDQGKYMAAAAAAVYALALQKKSSASGHMPLENVSPWQIAHRSRMFNQQRGMYTRQTQRKSP